MKFLRLIFCLSILIQSGLVSAQSKVNLGIGYNIGSHIKTEGLGFVIDRYNETRPFLTEKMKQPRFFRGMNFAMEVFYPKALIDFEWVSRKSDVNSEISTSSTGRDFRYKFHSFNMGVGLKLNKKKSGVMGPYLGLDFSTISIRNFTRTFQTGQDKPEFDKINSDVVLGFSPFLQFVGNRLTAKFYYQWMLIKGDYWDVNRKINPNTWSGDDFDAIKGKTSSAGLSIRYNLIKNEN